MQTLGKEVKTSAPKGSKKNNDPDAQGRRGIETVSIRGDLFGGYSLLWRHHRFLKCSSDVYMYVVQTG